MKGKNRPVRREPIRIKGFLRPNLDWHRSDSAPTKGSVKASQTRASAMARPTIVALTFKKSLKKGMKKTERQTIA